MKAEESVVISTQALKRMPYYLQHLKAMRDQGIQIVSATTMANLLELNEVQVRKDFAASGSQHGRPKTGFLVADLIENMELLLGYNNIKDAVLVGVGSLGHALLSFRSFAEYGVNIVAAFDIDQRLIGREIAGKPVFHMDELQRLVKRMNIRIGIITSPVETAQQVCDLLVQSGILAIWNFAPLHLKVPGHILVQNENMAASLALLSKHLENRMYPNDGDERMEGE